MGRWGTAVSGNDDYMEVYEFFQELYFDHSGKDWVYSIADVKKKIAERFSFQLSEPGLENEIWFAQAKAFWDYGIPDKTAYQKVKQIVKSGSDLEWWRKLEATEKQIRERKKALDTFFAKITGTNPKPFQRKKRVRIKPPFEAGVLLTFFHEKYYYAGVVSGYNIDVQGRNVIHLLNYRSVSKPAAKDLLTSSLMAQLKEPAAYHRNMWANRVPTRVHGFLLNAKGLANAKTKFERVGEIEFHDAGYYKDGVASYCDLTKYSWDVLPAFAALNYKGTRTGTSLLSWYTTEVSFSNKEYNNAIQSFKKKKKIVLYKQELDPGKIFAWITVNEDKKKKVKSLAINFALNGYLAMNTGLVNNILMRLFYPWASANGFELDTDWSSFEEYKKIGKEYLSYYENISDAMSKIEAEARKAGK